MSSSDYKSPHRTGLGLQAIRFIPENARRGEPRAGTLAEAFEGKRKWFQGNSGLDAESERGPVGRLLRTVFRIGYGTN